MLQLDLQQIVSQALAFLLLWWALKRLAWKPLLSVLDQRRARIEEGFRRIEQDKADLQRLQQALTQRLATIDEEARGKIQQAIQEGRRIAGEIQEEARAQAQGILAKSQETIELELGKAKVTLRDEVADMTVAAVERLLNEKMTQPTDQRLIAAILDDLGSHAA